MERRVQWIDKALEPPEEAKEESDYMPDARLLGLGNRCPMRMRPRFLRRCAVCVPQCRGMTQNRISQIGGFYGPARMRSIPDKILHGRFSTLTAGRGSLICRIPRRREPVEYLLSTGRMAQYNSAS